MRYIYSRWDGTQTIFPGSEDLFDEIADQIVEGSDLRSVLRRMMQHGTQGRRGSGLQELMERLRQARERNLQR